MTKYDNYKRAGKEWGRKYRKRVEPVRKRLKLQANKQIDKELAVEYDEYDMREVFKI